MGFGYAILNSILNISGKSNISKNTWDIHFENVKITTGSVEATKVPTIENATTVDFEAQLNLPGDFYEFTVDVVNSGTIDAMIESIIREPELTNEQKKYLNYIIEYENGEQVQNNQLVKADEFVRLKVRVEIKKDVASSDLPEVGDVLYLSFNFNYVQANQNVSEVIDNGVLFDVGAIKCLGSECFYVISSTTDMVTMLAKYNLQVGKTLDYSTGYSDIQNPTGVQVPNAIGGYSIDTNSGVIFAIKEISSTNYWQSTITEFPAYVVNENSYYYEYLQNYKAYFERLGITINEMRLITVDDLKSLGCVFNGTDIPVCSNSPSWLYSTSYWTGTAYDMSGIWAVYRNEVIRIVSYSNPVSFGARPVVTVSKDYFR